MMKLKFLTFFLAIIVALASCGGDAIVENTNTEPAAEQTPATQVSEIAHANTALAEGNRLLDENMTEEAILAYRRAVELDPTLGEAYFKMGIGLGLIESEQMRSGTGEYVPGETNTGKNYKPESARMFEKAVATYKKYLAKNEKDATGHFNLGLAYNKLNLDKEAEEAFEEAVKLRPDDEEFQTELGGIRVKLAKYREAVAPLKKALELDPENSQAANFLEEAQAGARRVEFIQKDNSITGRKVTANRANTIDAAKENTRSSNTQPPPKPPTPRTTPHSRQTPRRD